MPLHWEAATTMTPGEEENPNMQAPRLSDFARRSREYGKKLEHLALTREHQMVDGEHRNEMRSWLTEAQSHTADPDAFRLGLINEDSPLDYAMLANIYRSLSELVRDYE
jgi:hypothetical protein